MMGVYVPMLEKVFLDLQQFFSKTVPIEQRYTGFMHELSKEIQEQQGEVDCYV